MRGLNRDDGAIAVLLGTVLVVVFGFVAIAVDVGALYQERRELQNGADAAALAAAQECIYTGICNDTAHDGIADEYADANANDAEAQGDVTAFDSDTQSLTATVTTQERNGGGALRHWFAGVIGTPESTLEARATVSWGPPPGGSMLTTLPLTLSNCSVEDGLVEQIQMYGASSSTSPPGLMFAPFPLGA
jgi:Flp pilus assembly protein TadG